MTSSLKTSARNLVLCLGLLALGGCSTWSAGNVHQSSQQREMAVKEVDPSHVIVTESDIKSHKYVSLGDISVSVNKTTIFNKNPTREQVNEALKKRAAKLGADAVILARYGDVGIGVMTWGSLEGKGRAVKFVKK